MEVDEIKSDLYALRQLYALLQSLVTRENVFKSVLDERALQLLKKLLDSAMHRLSTLEMKGGGDDDDQPKVATKSKQRHDNNTSDQQQIVNADFGSSSTGFSTPTSLGFDDDIDDDANSDAYDDDDDDDQCGNLSKQVSKSIGELDSHILAFHLHEPSGSRVSSHPNNKPKEHKMESLNHDHHVPGSRFPAPEIRSNDKVYRKTRVDHHVGIRKRRPNHFTLAPRRGGIVPQTDQGEHAYSSDSEEDEENSGISPLEGSESLDDDHDDYDEVQSSSACSTCSGSNSDSSYGTAKSTNYPRRRRVEDCSDRVTRVSTLRRIKNKLGLIFHHHHHHHHHEYHHDHDHLRRSSDSKPPRGVFRDEGSLDPTTRGSRSKRRIRRDGGGPGDPGHFRALVEAMTKHVGGGGGRNNLPGRRGGGYGRVKINGNYGRGRVKFGFNKKTSQPHNKLKM